MPFQLFLVIFHSAFFKHIGREQPPWQTRLLNRHMKFERQWLKPAAISLRYEPHALFMGALAFLFQPPSGEGLKFLGRAR